MSKTTTTNMGPNQKFRAILKQINTIYKFVSKCTNWETFKWRQSELHIAYEKLLSKSAECSVEHKIIGTNKQNTEISLVVTCFRTHAPLDAIIKEGAQQEIIPKDEIYINVLHSHWLTAGISCSQSTHLYPERTKRLHVSATTILHHQAQLHLYVTLQLYFRYDISTFTR
jgi:hypothetical protein